jgi:hypothetical protein
MIKKYSFLLLFLIAAVTNAQVTYNANGGSSFAGPVGAGSMEISHDATNIYFNVTKGNPSTSNLDNFLVIYIDNGSTGRTVIDVNVSDFGDSHRRAISKSNSGDLNFPPGFEATHAIAVENNFGGIWQIPSTGNIGTGGANNELIYKNSVGSSDGPTDFTMTLAWADLGLASTDSIQFLAYYGNPNDPNNQTFSSNEGYGDGIFNNGNQNGYGAMTFTTYFDYPSGDKYGVATTANVGFWNQDSTWTNGNPPSPNDQITINHNLSINVDFTIENSFTASNGTIVGVESTAVLTLNGNLTVQPAADFGFNSDANGSAQFLNGPAAAISGEVGVARFIPTGTTSPRRAYRFITSSVDASQSIYENWQTGGQSLPGIGIHITGSTTGANGFDQTISGNPSAMTYGLDTSDNTYKWSFLDNTDTKTFSAGEAFNVFVRGDRNYDLTTASAPNIDVRIPSRGTLKLASTVNSGPLRETTTAFTFVGNPYQATIDMNLVTKNNVNGIFLFLWDPNLSTRGSYLVVDMRTDPKRFIQPGQAFFVVTASNGAASLDFKATDKVVSENAVGPFSTPTNRPSIDVKLMRDFNGATVQSDYLTLFLDGDNAINQFDAPKPINFDENMAIDKNGDLFMIENRAMPIHNEVINLNFTDIGSTSYTINIDLNDLTTGLSAVLHDNFSNTDAVLNAGMNAVPLTFDLNDAQSIDPSRFELRFVDTTLSVAQVDGFSFQMFPNPTTDHQVAIRGSFDGKTTTATLFNTLGQQVMKSDVNTNDAIIDLQGLDAGIYLVKVVSGNDQMTKKLVIK